MGLSDDGYFLTLVVTVLGWASQYAEISLTSESFIVSWFLTLPESERSVTLASCYGSVHDWDSSHMVPLWFFIPLYSHVLRGILFILGLFELDLRLGTSVD